MMNNKMKYTAGGKKKKAMKKGGFPDMNGDGKTTQADIFLKKKQNGTIKNGNGGPYKKKKKKLGMGGTPKMYKSGGFLEPKIPNIDNL